MEMPSDEFNFIIFCGKRRPLADITREMNELARTLCSDVFPEWPDMDIFISDCDADIARYFIAASRYCFSGDKDEVEGAKRVMESSRWDVKKRSLLLPFFRVAAEIGGGFYWDYVR